MLSETMVDIHEHDKLDETFAFRIPELTKKMAVKLSPEFKKKLNAELLMTIARVLHEADFDPRKYLSTKA